MLIVSLVAKARREGHSIPYLVLNRLVSWIGRAAFLPLSRPTANDPTYAVRTRFFDAVNAVHGAHVLEIGARARSGTLYRHLLASHVHYVGMDILDGPNVDVVGDAHALSRHFAPSTIDALFSISVFEHLAMPWKVILEMNRILKTGGLVFVGTHPLYPHHDRPWDFYRFTEDGFRALFNRATGFEIIEVQEGLPCRVIPLGFEPSMRGMARHQDAHLAVSLYARKISDPDPRMRWDVDLQEVLETHYPA